MTEETITPPTPPVLPPPRFAVDTDLDADELDVDLEDDEQDDEHDRRVRADTQVEQREFLGEYSSLTTYFCRILEDLIDPSVIWILGYLDMRQIQRRFEAGKYRYFHAGKGVYRTAITDDAPSPWMPTRGGV